ncbi:MULTISPECIES: flagellar basal body-associated FliL family protein [Brevibacillus]|jgi:flagellar FliL protein|uniref:Flagellar protein FliL n=1 Tax=Brevibacillus borstelensis AK1 TaxID=1300222 RepID=M8DKP7_9BACL|nr:flagellar basal body-associated FliL family protein [Brevibacillus borstelensis]EMT54183.1 flagellar FliL protein [Brevibacillus borstelensis AK1]KKX54007.1 flagellar basal body protein FliL [Brevibacillus borstelensis cifa_chp40]MBE5398032.1 flagellar basal body-associated FliL family protein [Brevibacillus borstelensis]MCC0563453.1 flagellar basal body-associated FliL family protein [Brevibacillus borstelensis]MCM3470056.1 flagellar basal body-associated FliL family protein [Brevibacillus
MFQNRLFNMALIIIIAISLLGVISFVLWQTYLSPAAQSASHDESKEVKALSAKEMQEYSVDTGEITTNLLSKNYIIVRFTITADSSSSKEELEQRLPQVNQIIIKTLAGLEPDDIKGTEGINKLEAKIMNEISALMQEGKIVQVITTKQLLS